MEEKILLQVKTDDEGTNINCSVDGMEENFKAALAIHTIIERTPGIALFLLAIQSRPELFKSIAEGTFEIPDFDKILKEIK